MTAKVCKQCQLTLMVSDFNSHGTTQDGLTQICKTCIQAQNKTYSSDNNDKIKQKRKEYYQKNKQTIKERTKKWIENNKEHKKQKDKEIYLKHKKLGRIKKREYSEGDRSYYKTWRKENKHKVLASIAKRRAQKKNATPKWAEYKLMECMYQEAIRLTALTGIPFQVDHILPLNSDVVCGLHCIANLQLLTAMDNNSKKNKLIE